MVRNIRYDVYRVFIVNFNILFIQRIVKYLNLVCKIES